MIGIHHCNLTLGIARRMSLELQINNVLWALCGKSKRQDALALHDVMVQLWSENNQVNLNKKDVIRKKISVGRWETHATHFLIKS
jgi:hypothetical protein